MMHSRKLGSRMVKQDLRWVTRTLGIWNPLRILQSVMDRTERYCLVLASETLPLEKKKETDILCQVVFIVLLFFFSIFPHVISQQSEGKGPVSAVTQLRCGRVGILIQVWWTQRSLLLFNWLHVPSSHWAKTCITLGPLLKLGFPSWMVDNLSPQRIMVLGSYETNLFRVQFPFSRER